MTDLKNAVRQLIKRAGYTAAAVTTLGLGLAGSAIIFAVVKAVLIAPLPYRAPEKLVVLRQANPEEQIAGAPVSLPDFRDWRRENDVFAGLTASPAFTFRGLLLTDRGEPTELRTGYVAGDFFGVLGVRPALGRFFGSAADVAGENRVVVLSHQLWQGRFGGDPSVVGRSVRLDDAVFTVVGVAPPHVRLPSPEVEVWAPLSVIDSTRISHHLRDNRWLVPIGRLAPGVSAEQAAEGMSLLASRLAGRYPEANSGWTAVQLASLRDEVVGEARDGILVLQAAIGLALLIACVNVAGLVLARTTSRRRELAVRAALGASRFRLIRQLLTEAVVLGLLAGMLGVGIAAGGLSTVVGLAGNQLPRANEVRLDGTVAIAVAVVAIAVSLVYGLIPALASTRGREREALSEVRGGGPAEGARTTRHILTSAEIAIAVVLVCATALLLNSLWRLHRVDPGFDPSSVLAVQFTIPSSRYPTGPEYRRAYFAMLAEVRRVPGVISAGAAQILPGIGSDERISFRLPADDPGDEPREAVWRTVSPGYFETLRIPVLAGRAFSRMDDDGPPVAIVNRLLAERLWPNRDPVGEQILLGRTGATVVGVVGDVRYEALSSPAEGVVYRPQAQHSRSRVGLVVRAQGDPADVADAVTAALRRVEPDQPIRRILPLEDLLAGTTAESRALALGVGLFAAFALALAALGVFSVVSYSVAQRTREIGLRVALGAHRADVLRLIIGEGLRLALTGATVGIILALLAGRVLASRLYGVSPSDPASLGAVVIVLLLTAMAASYLPARRAARVDPMQALRYE